MLLLYFSLLGGEWSQDGCQVVFSDEDRTVCQCDHLTNFAVLMDVAGTKVYLKYISIPYLLPKHWDNLTSYHTSPKI